MFDECHHLVVGGFARLHDSSLEIESFARPRVIQVDGHILVVDVHHLSVEVLPFLVLQGDDGTQVDVLVVEFPVNEERFARNLGHRLVDVFAEPLLGRQGEVEVVAFLQGIDVVFEFFVRDAESADEGERLTGVHLLLFMRRSVFVDGEKLVSDGDEFVGLFLHLFLIKAFFALPLQR